MIGYAYIQWTLDRGSGYTWIECVTDMRKNRHTYGMAYFASLKRSENMRIFLVIHVSKIKTVREFPNCPVARLVGSDADQVDFEEALLPEDSWIQVRNPDEYEVDRISDMRTGKRTRYRRIYREFLVHWRIYEYPTWVDEADLNSGVLLYEFLRDRTNRNRFGVMLSHEEP
ncbi:hypothetical protein PHMEG_0008101 [Phytophthora megakarya]|uniref:Chromo domain-containing protein n=1 Tax=Phytophthora megakarya TaxID=4795 RepID=A0A225WJJ1_9STRA|nr:hypothetical protein PHMEG_0008101 [Phytophthora megakarya]